MILRFSPEEAEKWALRDLRLSCARTAEKRALMSVSVGQHVGRKGSASAQKSLRAVNVLSG